ncbi:tetratricopeptide repeat protein [Polyangium sorediatum]|uniref:Tetratricopeptide repeat protein n=1 Tax=Polyangium sorediatum TaxID=889274 RepID=A0ABT6P476_9BACT|nr:tetratricopeptide repeat protein [Polyangium sorediatum]MDI1435415.1 tetratricopeptide repeat protein [Polyangium sorediatum]
MADTSARERGSAALGVGWLLVVGLFASSGGAQPAQESEEQKKNIARGYVISGDEAFEQGDMARALDRYERAERLIPAPTVRLRIARVLAKQGKLVEARVKYKAAATADVASDAPDVFFKAVVEAQKELAALEPRIPSVQIDAPSGAGGATIDKTVLEDSALGAPIPVNPGPHTIELPCCGIQTTSPKEGERVRLTFTVRPTEAPAPSATGPNVRLIAGVSTLGVGVVSLGVGFVGVGMVQAANSDPIFLEARSMYGVQDNVCELVAGSEPLMHGVDRKGVLYACNRGDTGRLLQLVFFPVAGLMTGVGIYLLATSGRGDKKPASSRVEVLPTAGKGYGGLLVQGSF